MTTRQSTSTGSTARTEVVATDVGCPPICMYCEFPMGEFPQVLTARFTLHVDQTLLRKLYVCFRCSLTFRYTNQEHQQRFLKKCRDADEYWRCWVALERLCQYVGAGPRSIAQIVNYTGQEQYED